MPNWLILVIGLVISFSIIFIMYKGAEAGHELEVKKYNYCIEQGYDVLDNEYNLTHIKCCHRSDTIPPKYSCDWIIHN